MNKIKLFLFGLLSIGLAQATFAHITPGLEAKVKEQKKTVKFRGGDCAPATKQIDQDINNVRARLLNGGDVWWDTDDGRYIVPKVAPGQPEVSSLFAGAVWIGGLDPGGNLKLAAKTYGSGQGQTDFYPGPLDQFTGGTNQETCANWDRFFKVLATEIKEHISNYNKALKGELNYTAELIPAGVKGWPSKGNPHFLDVWGFELPSTGQGLAGYFDQNDDGVYDPLDGDFPIVEIRNCTNFGSDKTVTDDCGNQTFLPGVDPQFPDEMIFWIYNDAGGTHSESGADAIQMEIQVQTFAYATNDFINNMTFQRYKLINRAVEDITSCYFAMWADPDLGCYTDDYIGCDVDRSLAYVYNQDAADGQTGCTCPQGVNTYCTNIPILGIDYFRGPRGNVPCFDDQGNVLIDSLTGDTVITKIELGMSSFTYYVGLGAPAPGTSDPGTAQEFYNYITGRWRDGSPLQFGGTGYNTGGVPVNYAFPDNPACSDAASCWSMCTSGLAEGDRRTLQATGPFVLKPGDVNELIVGMVWLPEQDYPCPDITELQKADDVAQALFNNCFDITDGPDAPDVDWLELDREIVAVLTNDDETSNNAKEAYSELDLNAPESLPEDERKYRFEGYKVFQLANANVSVTDLNDPSKAALVFQSDVDNQIGKIYNWDAVDNPNIGDPDIWVPEEKVLVPNPNGGVRHTFKISEDVFTQSTDRRLINHKKYYFIALAYAHNNYDEFDPFASGGVGSGQTKPYLEGRGNIKTYTVIPRPLTYQVLSTEYGESVEITRLAGTGVGSHFVDMTSESRNAIATGSFDGTIVYKENRGPFDVTVFNPLDVKDGKYQLTLVDSDTNDTELDDAADVKWKLTNVSSGAEVQSEGSIEALNEQIIPEFGFSITMKDGLEPGNNVGGTGNVNNGALGYEEEYGDNGIQWLGGVPDGFTPPGFGAAAGIFDYVQTGANEPDYDLDPTQAYSQLGPGYFVPYYLCDYRGAPDRPLPYITPVWTGQGNLVRQSMKFENMNNVDIVFTSNKDLWSRCIVVESTLPSVSAFGFTTESNDGMAPRNHFDTRGAASVGKEDADGDGRADEDGDGFGMGWFPGYAIDVETGKRLNIFFGEASIYRCDEPFFRDFLNACNAGFFDDNMPTGGDMMFNPTSQGAIENVPAGTEGLWQAITGGMHFMYVTNQEYDECATLRDGFKPGINPLFKARAFKDVTWTGYPMMMEGTEMLSYADGLIPNELTVKLRVDSPFEYSETTAADNGHPTYEFELVNKQARAVADEAEVNSALDAINVVPNPYYGFSPYETSQFATTVKITNLPAKCEVTIYTLDGKFIRNYNRDEIGAIRAGGNRAIPEAQITPALEWDLRNNKGIPVASGVYLIHVDSPDYGERVLKWFGIARQYDPSGL